MDEQRVFSYNQIVPGVLQDELISLGDAHSLIAWRIGDIVEEVIEYVTCNRMEVSREEIHAAVGLFCGKKARTVREYAHIARLYVPEIREAYSVLRFDHFRLAATFSDPRVILEWAIAQTDEKNRPATVDACEAHFSAPLINAHMPTAQDDRQDGSGAAQSEKIEDSTLAPENMLTIPPGAQGGAWSQIAGAVEQIRRVKGQLKLNAAERNLLDEALAMILRVLEQLARKSVDKPS